MVVLVAIVDGTLLVHLIWGCELVFMMVQLALKYQDEDDLLEYQNTCVAEFKGHVVVKINVALRRNHPFMLLMRSE